MENRKSIVLVIPSSVISAGFESLISKMEDFYVSESIADYSRQSEARLRSINPDIVIIDPSVFDFQSRKEGRNIISEFCDAIVIAVEVQALSNESLNQYDGYISLFDNAEQISQKLRTIVESRQTENGHDNGELSAREKEILVCVAQGLLNKEIADKLNLSIYTVITHRKNITRKIGIKTVAGLTVYALLNNLIDTNSIL